MIKSLPKSFERKQSELPYFYNDHWITNGSFAIARNKIKDSFRYCLNKPGVNQPEIDRIIPTQVGSICLGRTNRLYDMKGGDYGRVFIDEFNNEYVVNEKYVQHFSLEALYTHGIGEVLTNEDITFIIMPMNPRYVEVQKCA